MAGRSSFESPVRRSATTHSPKRYRITLAYDGAGFHGWQKQHPPDQPPMRTVQQVLEDTLCRLMRQPIVTTGSGRTDAGVHAEGQVAHFDAATPIPTDRLRRAVSQKLPRDVEARSIEEVTPTFHAMRDARSKQYQYRLWTAPVKPLGLRHLVHHCWAPLDIDRMNDAASRLVGTHDFAGFTVSDHGRQSTTRTIHRCEVVADLEPTPAGPEPITSTDGPRTTTVCVEGDGFLYNMVRIIAGTLVAVGRGKSEPAMVDEILRSGDRRLAGATLPPNGLVLKWVWYGQS